MTKYQYLIRSIGNFSTSKSCPYCGSKISKIVDRKFIVTTLNKCSGCNLLFRHPLDTLNFNRKFYQEDYEQNDGMTTSMPSNTELATLLIDNFYGTKKDFSNTIKILQSLLINKPGKIIDYGANWGYTSFQFKKAGFEVESYEISMPRAKYGEKLGLTIFTDENSLTGNADIFFNSHVIEHLPNIKSMFLLAQKLLKDDGYFVAYCPNGSEDFKQKNPHNFHTFWGQVHPNYLSSDFFSRAFKNVPYLIGSDISDKAEIQKWEGNTQRILDISGSELFVFAKLKKQIF